MRWPWARIVPAEAPRSLAMRDGWNAARVKAKYGREVKNPYDWDASYHSNTEWHAGYIAFNQKLSYLGDE